MLVHPEKGDSPSRSEIQQLRDIREKRKEYNQLKESSKDPPLEGGNINNFDVGENSHTLSPSIFLFSFLFFFFFSRRDLAARFFQRVPRGQKRFLKQIYCRRARGREQNRPPSPSLANRTLYRHRHRHRQAE